jgi:hypothetical protein
MNEPQQTESIRHRTNIRVSRLYGSLFFSGTMKKFFVFILLLTLLVAAEYYFFTEIFTQKRPLFIVLSLGVMLASLYQLVRFFKRSFISY